MRAKRLTICILSAVFLAALAFSHPARASNGTGWGNATPGSNGNGVDLGAVSGTGTPAKSGGGGGGTSDITCTSTPLATLNDPSIPNPGLLGGTTDYGQVIPPNTPGTWVFLECFHANGTTAGRSGVTFYPQNKPVDPVQLMQTAKNHLPLPAPAVQLSPDADHGQYVQMPSRMPLTPQK